MWALDRKSPGVVLVERRPTRASTLAGVLGLCLALVPLSIAPDLNVTQIVASLCFAAVGASLVFLGRPRPKSVEIARKLGGVVWGEEPLPPPAYVLLDGASTEDPPAYQAYVVWDDGRRRIALERDEPHEVLRDALLLAARLEIDLRPGWGLEKHLAESGFAAAWQNSAAGSASSGSLATVSVDLPAWPMQRRPAAVTFIAGLFVLVETVFLARSPSRLVVPSAFALALSGITAALALGLGAVLLGLRRRVELSRRGVESTTLLFGFSVKPRVLLARASSHCFGVSPDRGPVRHVLFATEAGPLALAADDDSARRLGARSSEPMREEALLEPAPVGATSARYRGPDRPARLRS